MKRMATIVAVVLLVLTMVIPVAADEPHGSSPPSLVLTLDLSQIEIPGGMDPGEVLAFYRAAQRQQLDKLISILLVLKSDGRDCRFPP